MSSLVGNLSTTSSNNQLLLVIFLFLVAIIGRNNQVEPASLANCPNASQIKPCTCDHDGLQCLRLNNTGLKRVFEAQSEHKAIRRVWINQTNLTALRAKSFGDYIIRDLYLDLNQIKKVEAGAFGEAAKTIQLLSLTRNLLTSFPYEDLKTMPKLKQLGLGHNKIIKLPNQAFPPSSTIESIDLSYNQITTIEPNALANLYKVSLIDLSKNKLKEIQSHSLVVKSTSEDLSISLRGNQISKVSVDAFGDYPPKTLDLSRNDLSYLDEFAFAPLLTNNTFINVSENPFSCYGCQLYKWLLELDSEHLNNLEYFSCSDGAKLEDLTLEMIGCT